MPQFLGQHEADQELILYKQNTSSSAQCGFHWLPFANTETQLTTTAIYAEAVGEEERAIAARLWR
jgi:hypothetical protein